MWVESNKLRCAFRSVCLSFIVRLCGCVLVSKIRCLSLVFSVLRNGMVFLRSTVRGFISVVIV